jgi:hypothetical protein
MYWYSYSRWTQLHEAFRASVASALGAPQNCPRACVPRRVGQAAGASVLLKTPDT